MDKWPILEEELIRCRDVSLSIKRIMGEYEEECQVLIQQVKGKSFDDVQVFFESLYDIQNKLSTATYKYGFLLSYKLKKSSIILSAMTFTHVNIGIKGSMME